MTDAERLKLKFGDKSRAQFVRDTEFSGGLSMVSQHMSGNRPINLVAAKKYADWLNVPIGEISPAAEEALSVLAQKTTEYPTAESKTLFTQVGVSDSTSPYTINVRKVKLRLSAGISGFSVDNEIEDGQPVTFKKAWFDKNGYIPEKLIALKVKGESMEPTLYDGDTVVINTVDSSPEDGNVYAVNYEGEPVVKRLIRDIGQWWLASDNSDQRRYSKKICNDGNCLIIGKVVHKQSDRI